LRGRKGEDPPRTCTDAEEMASTLIVKVSNGSEIRRFTTSPETLSWKELSKRICKLFDTNMPTEVSPSKGMKVTYVDDEGDRITVSSDVELSEAVSLALTTSPAVLRIAVVDAPALSVDKSSSAGVHMSDASTNPEVKNTVDAGTSAKPTTTEAATSNGHGAHSTSAHASTATDVDQVPAEFAHLFNTLKHQLPALAAQLPDAARKLLQHGEIDIGATLAATDVANAAQAAAAAAAGSVPTPNGFPAVAGAHPGVRCDRTGQCPIIGNRYHLVGFNYDLCETEFQKLDEAERAKYIKIPPCMPAPAHPTEGGAGGNGDAAAHGNGFSRTSAGAPAAADSGGIHPGVECDRSGMCPIVGTRYNLRGHDYDLCQAEFDKLSSTEKLLYTPIAPRVFMPPWRNRAARHHGGGAGCGRWGWGGGGGCRPHNHPNANTNSSGAPHVGPPAGPPAGTCARGLAARFVKDVTIFDGTQMAPGTRFTKIWRLKNVGEVAWPPGTRMLFVGGDQMSTEMSVPLARASPVMPGDEVDVAVEMWAPSDIGRYLGYWRLMGPHGRKFGHRVWCHVQVVDDATNSAATFTDDDLARTREEIERKKKELEASEMDVEGAQDEPRPPPGMDDAIAMEATPDGAPPAGATTAASDAPTVAPPAGPVPPPTTSAVECQPLLPMAPAAHGDDSDDGSEVLVTDVMAMDMGDDAEYDAARREEVKCDEGTRDEAKRDEATRDEAKARGKEPADDEAEVRAALAAMGFADATLVEIAISKHGTDLKACAADLAAASEWEDALDDLEEMGFANRELNKSLMLRHDGNLKRTVKALVGEA